MKTRILETEFKNGDFLRAEYEYDTYRGEITDLDIISAEWYEKGSDKPLKFEQIDQNRLQQLVLNDLNDHLTDEGDMAYDASKEA